jgi:hypothetical protein
MSGQLSLTDLPLLMKTEESGMEPMRPSAVSILLTIPGVTCWDFGAFIACHISSWTWPIAASGLDSEDLFAIATFLARSWFGRCSQSPITLRVRADTPCSTLTVSGLNSVL